MNKAIRPPDHLSGEMKTFWRAVLKDYDLPAEHLRILQVTAEQFDRGQAARERIEKDGMVTKDGKRHPLIGVEAKSTELFLRGVRDLGLEVSDAAK